MKKARPSHLQRWNTLKTSYHRSEAGVAEVAHRARKVLQGQRVQWVHKVQREQQARKDRKVQPEQTEQMVRKVHKDQQVQQVHKGQQVRQARRAHKGQQAAGVILIASKPTAQSVTV
jgi:hypothetical protein